MLMPSYAVIVERQIFHRARILVTARNEEDAETKACEMAETYLPSEWELENENYEVIEIEYEDEEDE